MPERKTDVDTAKAAISLAEGGKNLPADAPCCGWCGGIKLDCAQAPESPAKMLARGSGCPLSIVAYSIRAHKQKGDDVQVVAASCGAPTLRVNGKPVDPLNHYGRERCGCSP